MCDTTHTLWKKKTQGGFLGALMGIGRVVARLAPRIARTAIRHAPKIARTAGRMARQHSPKLIKKGIKHGLTEGGKMAVDKIIEEQKKQRWSRQRM